MWDDTLKSNFKYHINTYLLLTEYKVCTVSYYLHLQIPVENASFHNLQSDQGYKFSEIFTSKSLSSNRVEDFNSNKLLNFAGHTVKYGLLN